MRSKKSGCIIARLRSLVDLRASPLFVKGQCRVHSTRIVEIVIDQAVEQMTNVEPACAAGGIRVSYNVDHALCHFCARRFLSLPANGGQDGILWASYALPPPGGDTGYTKGEINGRLLTMDAISLESLWASDDSQSVKFAKFVPPVTTARLVFRTAYRDGIYVYGLKRTNR
jgi:hypothetical protein